MIPGYDEPVSLNTGEHPPASGRFQINQQWNDGWKMSVVILQIRMIEFFPHAQKPHARHENFMIDMAVKWKIKIYQLAAGITA